MAICTKQCQPQFPIGKMSQCWGQHGWDASVLHRINLMNLILKHKFNKNSSLILLANNRYAS
jgi:hypothetical protein